MEGYIIVIIAEVLLAWKELPKEVQSIVWPASLVQSILVLHLFLSIFRFKAYHTAKCGDWQNHIHSEPPFAIQARPG